MSQTLPPPFDFMSALEDVFRVTITKNGGSVIKTQISEDWSKTEYEASLCEDRYHIYLTLVWTGSRYKVERFASVETVADLGHSVYLQADLVLVYELALGKWQVTSPKSLRALFRAHTDWSLFFGLVPIFHFN